MYPLEVQLAQGLAAGNPITGVTWDAVRHSAHDLVRIRAALEG